MAAIANRFVDPVIQKVIDRVFQYAEDQVRWQTGMKEELERLRENHPKIQAVVHFASSQEQMRDRNPALNKWLWELRDAIDDADDVLDEIEYMKHGEQLSRNRGKRKVRSGTMSFLRETAYKLRKVGKRALKLDPNLKRIDEVVQKLDKVSAGVTTFFDLVKDAKQEHHEQQLELYRERETGCLPKNDLIGRGKDKEFVLKWLRNPSNEYQATLYNNISLLSIVGLGGMGKTTLLQHVYEDKMTEEFDLKMWVCVSNNFNTKQVIANMLESLKNEKSRLETLEALQRHLVSNVESKKFLLVLDDIWDDDKEQAKNKWRNVLAPLAYGKLGSKILVTTRMESVTSIISEVLNKKKEILRLEGMNDDECLKLLLRYAFHGVDNLDAYHNLRSIAEKMVKKLLGSPLATTVMGSILNFPLEESYWTRVLNCHIGRQNDILSILKLSYTFLPEVLQKCLSFCCTFPQDYELDKDDIVQMWIALDFIQPSINEGETLMDVGERYFDLLVKKSLLDKFQKHGKIFYKLHDMLHDMLRAISAQQCFSIVNDEECVSRTPKIIRHLYVLTNNLGVLENMEKIEKLRSLFFTCYKDDSSDCFGILTKIFKAVRNIRLLVIYAMNLKQFPKEIGHLIHLRYLKVSIQGINIPDELPRSLSNLYHLQFFYCNFMNSLSHGIHEVGKLKSLQRLDRFYVRNEVGYTIDELEHMNELNLLRIRFVENLEDARDACSAKLCDKKNLRYLSLVWPYNIYELEVNDFMMTNAYENVLENLKPHSSLEKLEIKFFMGARPATWMKDVNFFSNLEYIKIENCERLQTLPPFWLLGVLKYLYLISMPNIKGFDYKLNGNDKVRVFPSLQVLHIEDLETLEEWFVATDDCLFPRLTELYLYNCPNLQELPALPPHLEKLVIIDIPWKGCNWLQVISNYRSISIQNCLDLFYVKGHQEVETSGKCHLIISELVIHDPLLLLMEPLRRISSIRNLVISNNDAVISFPPEVEQWFLQVSPSIHELEFENLESLQSFPFFLESFSSLKILCMRRVPQFQSLLNIPTSLEQLELIELESLQCLPSLLSFSSLETLNLKSIPLQELPNLPPSLCRLYLSNLSNLHCLPSCLPSLSSLKTLKIKNLPELRDLSDLPPSLPTLNLSNLPNLHCLPSCLPSLSSLETLKINNLPELRDLSDLPPSLLNLNLSNLPNLHCLPSCLPRLSSLQILKIKNLPEFRELPDLPPSLPSLLLLNLSNLHRLPSSLSSLKHITISSCHQLRELPDLSPSLEILIVQNNHPELQERYQSLVDNHPEHRKLLTINHLSCVTHAP